MRTYELCLGNQTIDDLLDKIAQDANAVVPGLGRERARAVADLMFRSRVTQTEACGHYAVCAPTRSLWGDRRAPEGPLCCFRWNDIDPFDLPNIFAVVAADMADLSGGERDAAEGRLADVFRGAVGPLLFRNDQCGRSAVCLARETDPFIHVGRR